MPCLNIVRRLIENLLLNCPSVRKSYFTGFFARCRSVRTTVRAAVEVYTPDIGVLPDERASVCAKHIGETHVRPWGVDFFAPKKLAPGSVLGSGRNFDHC